MPVACGEILVIALPGTLVRVQWVVKTGAVEYERVYRRPESEALVDGVDMNQNVFQIITRYEAAILDLQALLAEERRDNAALMAKMKPDAAYF